jgi:hypothetical protein
VACTHLVTSTRGRAVTLSLPVLACLAALFASPYARAGSDVGCSPSPVRYGTAPNADPRFATLPWVAPEPRAAGLIGHLFYYAAAPSVTWGKRHVRDLRMYSGGRSPDNRVNMKILWSGPSDLEGTRMTVRGNRVGSSEKFVQTLRVGPSIVNVPRPGCWRLTLTTGRTVTRLTATVASGLRPR